MTLITVSPRANLQAWRPNLCPTFRFRQLNALLCTLTRAKDTIRHLPQQPEIRSLRPTCAQSSRCYQTSKTMDELKLTLTGGTNGYTVRLRELLVRGASNYTVDDIKLGSSFEAIIRMPALILDAQYTSSGVLIILPASGNGTFHARFGGARALVEGSASTHPRAGKTYLNVDNLDVHLGVKDVNMRVRKVFNNNRILTEATNLFLRENGQEVLKIMEPQLKRKLSTLFAGIVNQLLRNVPVETFLLP